MGVRLLMLLAAACWCAGWLIDAPAPGRFVQEDVRIAAHGGRTTLAITILRPRGEGPFGAVILNHGVPLARGIFKGRLSPRRAQSRLGRG